MVHNGIKEICSRYGAERVIFGSGAPENSVAAAVSLVRYSDISDEEEELIASGNLLKLLEEMDL